MRRTRLIGILTACLMLLLSASPVGAFRVSVSGPIRSIGVARPIIGQQFLLAEGQQIHEAQIWLNGQPVQTDVTSSGLVSHTPEEPLLPGTYRVWIEIQVPYRLSTGGEGFYPLLREFTFVVEEGALLHLPEPDQEALQALEAVNRHRQAAGVDPFTYSPHLAAAAGAHAHYQAEYLEWNGSGEIPLHPLFTGYREQNRANFLGHYGAIGTVEVSAFYPTAREAVDAWMDSPYTRIALIRPGVGEMGYGQAHANRNASVIDAIYALNSSTDSVSFPPSGATGVATSWKRVAGPDPLRLYPGITGPLGYPITLTWAPRPQSLTLTRGALREPDGREVAVMRFAPGFDNLLADTVMPIPVRPLKPGTTYTVEMAGHRR